MWWFWESHGDRPRCRIMRVYSFHEYFTTCGQHIWCEKYVFSQQLYRAIGMVLPWLKSLWDRGEKKFWPDPEEKPYFPTGM
jgi:hypothetical protein